MLCELNSRHKNLKQYNVIDKERSGNPLVFFLRYTRAESVIMVCRLIKLFK